MPCASGTLSLVTVVAASLVVPPRPQLQPASISQHEQAHVIHLRKRAEIAELQAERLALEARIIKLRRDLQSTGGTLEAGENPAIVLLGDALTMSHEQDPAAFDGLVPNVRKEAETTPQVISDGLFSDLEALEDAQYRSAWSSLGFPESSYPLGPLNDTLANVSLRAPYLVEWGEHDVSPSAYEPAKF